MITSASMNLQEAEGSSFSSNRVYVVILNWNGWKDTIECLESVFNLNYPEFRVVICDNASTDDSVEMIRAWMRGDLSVESANLDLAHLRVGASTRSISFRELRREESELQNIPFDVRLTLIQNGGNLGFAGGSNVGLRYALRDPACQFCWLLNNDTVVDPSALTELVRVCDRESRVGLCGSLNLFYYDPRRVQAQGGLTYNRWTARVRTPELAMAHELGTHPPHFDYINGASLFVRRDFLEQVGLLEDAYFLYFEEIDWAMRAKGKFKLSYAPKSVIYHKEGATIGSSPDRKKRSLLSEKHLSRSRIIFTKKFFPWALPSVMFWIVFAALSRCIHGDLKRAAMMLSWSSRGLFTKPSQK